MLNRLLKQLKRPVQLSLRDVFLTIVPALLWTAAVLLGRPAFIKPWCTDSLGSCAKETVFVLDRLALGMDSRKADSLSFITQYTAGGLALLVPMSWLVLQLVRKRRALTATLGGIGTELTLMLQTVSWNGVFTELAHAIFNRPRPFVYSNPERLGLDFSNYTSFYSGHTSFSAAACAYLSIALLRGKAPRFIVIPILLIGASLIVMTGAFRVAAGRHFITDVSVGALAGITVAIAVACLHRSKSNALNA